MIKKHKIALNLFIVFTIVCAAICFVKMKNNKVDNIIEEIELSQNEKSEELAGDNEAHIMARTMTVVVNNVDENGDLIEGNFEYLMSYNSSSGGDITETKTSNSNGIISAAIDMPTKANYTYWLVFKQTKGADGYTSIQDQYGRNEFEVRFKEENGLICVDNCSVGDGVELVSTTATSVTVNIINKKIESELIPIMFSNVDGEGEDLNGATFTIKDNEMLKIATIEKDGCVLIEIPSPTSAKIQTYKIQQITAVDGYKKIKGEMQLNIEYEISNGKISAKAVYFVNVDYTKVNAVHFAGILTRLTFINTLKTEQDEQEEENEVATELITFKIKNENKNGEALSGGKFKMTDLEGVEQLGKITDDGEMLFTLVSPTEAGTQKYKISQIKAADGYTILNGEMEFFVEYGIENGKIVVVEAGTNVGESGYISVEKMDSKTVRLIFINEEKTQATTYNGLTSIRIVNKNKNGDILEGGTFRLRFGGTREMTLDTESVRMFSLKMSSLKEEKEYSIEQLTVADGYTRINGEINFVAEHEIVGISTKTNYASLSLLGNDNIQIEVVNDMTINITIINEEISSGESGESGETGETTEPVAQEMISFLIENKNKSDEELNGATFRITAGNDHKDVGIIKDGVAVFQLLSPTTAGKQAYYVEQLTAADGYNKISGEMKFYIAYEIQDGKIVISYAESGVVGTDSITVHNIDGVMIKLTIVNNEITENNETPEQLVKVKFKNVNENGEVLNGTSFKFCNDSYTTDENGEFEIYYMINFHLTTDEYDFSQVTAKEGYCKVKGTYTLKVSYDGVVGQGEVVTARIDSNDQEVVGITAERVSETEILVTITNKAAKTVTLKVKNQNRAGEALAGSEFRIGTHTYATEANGEAEFTIFVDPSETRKLVLVEQMSAIGDYERFEGSFMIIINYNSTNDVIDVSGGEIHVIQDETYLLIQRTGATEVLLTVINDEKTEEVEPIKQYMNIKIKNVNEEGEGIDLARFKVNERRAYEYTTYEGGIIDFYYYVTSSETDVFEWCQLAAAEGYYKLDGDFNLTIKYDKVGDKFQIAQVSTNAEEQGAQGITVEKVSNTEILLTVVNKRAKTVTFKIKNQNEAGEALGGSDFKIDGATKTTDENGEAIFTIWTDTSYRTKYLHVSQVSVAEGYKKISGVFGVVLYYSLENNDVTLLDGEVQVIQTGDKYLLIEKTGDYELVLTVINEEDKEEIVEKELVSFLIRNEAKDGTELNGAEFIVKDEEQEQTVGIVKDGAAIFQLLSPNKAGNQ